MRWIALILWIVFACLAGFAVFFGSVALLAHYDRGMLRWFTRGVPDGLFFYSVLLGGPIAAMFVAGFLGLRGRLPGARLRTKHQPKSFGFRPVQRSPLDVGFVDVKPPLTVEEIIQAVNEGRRN